nr:collagen alpha-2(I) chain-like [Kogia breviceps]
MAIGLPGLALGPGASDTHWDAEGGGAPAAAVAAAAAARGSGARERRGLGRGAQVTRRCRAGRPAGGAPEPGEGRRRRWWDPSLPPLACLGIAPSGLSRGAALAGGVRGDPSEGAVGPGRPAGPPRAGSAGPGDPRREPGRAPRGSSKGVLSRARPSGGAGAGLGALRCPGRAGRPSPGLLCVERRGGSARVGRDAHKLVGPRRRVRTQTKDGLCLGGARCEEGAVTPGPDSGRESGVRSGGRGAAGGLGSTPPPREGAGSAGAAGAGTARGDRTPSGRASDISPESSPGAPRLQPLRPGGPGRLRLLGDE